MIMNQPSSLLPRAIDLLLHKINWSRHLSGGTWTKCRQRHLTKRSRKEPSYSFGNAINVGKSLSRTFDNFRELSTNRSPSRIVFCQLARSKQDRAFCGRSVLFEISPEPRGRCLGEYARFDPLPPCPTLPVAHRATGQLGFQPSRLLPIQNGL